MKISSIDNKNVSTYSFGIKPVGYAKELITDILSDTFERYDTRSKEIAKDLLYKISKIGKHYHGENQPLELYAEKMEYNKVKFTTSDTDEELCRIKLDTDHLHFFRIIYEQLLNQKLDIRKGDAIREATDFLNDLYGK